MVAALWGGDFIAFVKQAAATGFFEKIRLANFDAGGNYDALVALGDHPPPGLILSARHHDNWPAELLQPPEAIIRARRERARQRPSPVE